MRNEMQGFNIFSSIEHNLMDQDQYPWLQSPIRFSVPIHLPDRGYHGKNRRICGVNGEYSEEKT